MCVKYQHAYFACADSHDLLVDKILVICRILDPLYDVYEFTLQPLYCKAMFRLKTFCLKPFQKSNFQNKTIIRIVKLSEKSHLCAKPRLSTYMYYVFSVSCMNNPQKTKASRVNRGSAKLCMRGEESIKDLDEICILYTRV